MIKTILLASMLFNAPQDNIRAYKDTFDKEPKQILFYYHKGGEAVKNAQDNIAAVLSRLDFVPQSDYIIRLVYETSLAESFGGKYTKQVRGSALGIYQIEPATYKDLMNWLNRRGLDKQIMSFYDKKSSLEKNLMHNVPFTTALCICHYYRYYGDNLADKANNIFNRARMWKERYNTRLGKGTIQGYIKKVVKYG